MTIEQMQCGYVAYNSILYPYRTVKFDIGNGREVYEKIGDSALFDLDMKYDTVWCALCDSFFAFVPKDIILEGEDAVRNYMIDNDYVLPTQWEDM